MKLNSFFLNQKQKFVDKTNNNEDREVIKFLNSLSKENKFKYLEVGSGLGRFPIKIKELFTNLDIECLEINSDLAKITEARGLKTTVSDAVKFPFNDENFDILHCSHIIEHFKYPDVANFLDEIIRITKNNGYIIIRSPLMHPDFYLDIDHIRPYPPETILNYFNNAQQQKVGAGNVKVIKCWYRKENLKLHNIVSSRIKYFINAILAILWVYIKFPCAKKNGYVLILQKTN